MSDDGEPFAPCDREGCGHLWSEHTYGNGCDICECDAHVMHFAFLSSVSESELRAELAAVIAERDALKAAAEAAS